MSVNTITRGSQQRIQVTFRQHQINLAACYLCCHLFWLCTLPADSTQEAAKRGMIRPGSCMLLPQWVTSTTCANWFDNRMAVLLIKHSWMKPAWIKWDDLGDLDWSRKALCKSMHSNQVQSSWPIHSLMPYMRPEMKLQCKAPHKAMSVVQQLPDCWAHGSI